MAKKKAAKKTIKKDEVRVYPSVRHAMRGEGKERAEIMQMCEEGNIAVNSMMPYTVSR